MQMAGWDQYMPRPAATPIAAAAQQRGQQQPPPAPPATLDQAAGAYAAGGLSALPRNLPGTLNLGADQNNPFTVQNQAGVQVVRGPNMMRPGMDGGAATGQQPEMTPYQAAQIELQRAQAQRQSQQDQMARTTEGRKMLQQWGKDASEEVDKITGDMGLPQDKRAMVNLILPKFAGLPAQQAAAMAVQLASQLPGPQEAQQQAESELSPGLFGAQPSQSEVNNAAIGIFGDQLSETEQFVYGVLNEFLSSRDRQ
jgi:hypothetical protein